MNRKYLIVFSSVLLLSASAYYLWANEFFYNRMCAIRGGKFSFGSRSCILKNCAETASCQESYGNIRVCKKLKPNLTKNELFFELGMLISNEDNVYIFYGNAAEKEKIKAVIVNGKVESLICGF